jgi:hypothetical protein
MSYIHPEHEIFVADEVRYLTLLLGPVVAHIDQESETAPPWTGPHLRRVSSAATAPVRSRDEGTDRSTVWPNLVPGAPSGDQTRDFPGVAWSPSA